MDELPLIASVLSSHADYIAELIAKIKAGSITPHDITRTGMDNQCRIGKWLEAIDNKTEHSNSYAALCTAHAEFHHQASILLGRAMAGEQTQAVMELEAIGNVTGGALLNVLPHLTHLVSEVDPKLRGLF